MKKIFFTLMLTASCVAAKAQTSVLHLNLGSHSETSDPVNYLNNLGHTQVRTLVKQVADSVIAKQIKWNMELDANFIRGTLINDTAYTNPNDILQWADNSPYIEVDPHNHFNASTNPYNYADLAHLLDSCGLTPMRKNVGGYLWDSTYWTNANEHWTLWQNGLNGNTYPTYHWPMKVLWGGGSPNHVNDDNTFGIWKPAGATSNSQFETHDITRNLTGIGGGCGTWVIFDTTSNPQWIVNSVVSYLNNFASQPVTSNTYYTATIMFNFKNITSTNFVQKIMTVINGLAPYGPNGTGQIVWETLTEKYDNWYTLHTTPSDHFMLACSGLNVGENELSNLEDHVTIFPNPNSGSFTISLPINSASSIVVKLYDLSGKEISSTNAGEQKEIKIETNGLAEGIYVCELICGSERVHKKIVVTK